MAKVEMDLSEFKRMEQVEADLRDALKKQKEQADKIEALQKEKLEIMESNEKKVTVVDEVRHVEVIHPRLTPHRVQEKLCRWLGIKKEDFDKLIRSNPNKNSWLSTDVLYHGRSLHSSDSYMFNNDMVRTIQKIFFDEEKRMERDCQKSVTYKGFDQVRAEIKEEYYHELDEDTKIKLKALNRVSKANDKLKLAVKGYKKEIEHSKANYEDIVKNLDDMHKEINLSKEKYSELKGQSIPMLLAHKTMEVLNAQNGIFGNKKAINSLKEIWKDADTRD